MIFPIFTIIIIATIISIFKYVENDIQAVALYIIAFGMVGMNIFVYYLINSIVERETALREQKTFEIQVKNQIEMYRSISENFEKQKKKTHEFKNHILCIDGLLKTKQYMELEKYVSNLNVKILEENNVIHTNHAIIDVIFNTKYQEALNKKIVFLCKVNDLSNVYFEDEDIVVLLANLLNNAIEACEFCVESKMIKIKFWVEDKHIILSVKNTCVNQIKYQENDILTSKTVDQEEHGIGIKNILRIVEKYNGEYVIQSDGKEFFFSIVFPKIK